MLDTNLKQQLNGYLQYIVNPIEISVSGNDSDKSAELLALASEIAEMSPQDYPDLWHQCPQAFHERRAEGPGPARSFCRHPHGS